MQSMSFVPVLFVMALNRDLVRSGASTSVPVLFVIALNLKYYLTGNTGFGE